jgi:CRISPR/Cas system endoribonuclease Cas6 (RAMP superfamily)
MQIKNDWDAYSVLSKIMVNVIQKVSEKVADDLHESIQQNTYEFGGLPNVFYYDGTKEPTYQFKNAFFFDDIVNNLKEIFSELNYHPEEPYMSWDKKTLHGNATDDMRKQLAEILNVDDQFYYETKPRLPYWDIFIEDEFANGKIKKYFDQYMREEFAKIGAIVN